MFSFGGKKREVRRPKLDRRNAVKNIDYEASWASTSSDESSVFRTERSIDLSPEEYGIRGSVEGEVELLYQNLGLSGPEDFAISAAAWEASIKDRSFSDLLPTSRLLYSDSSTAGSQLPEEKKAEVAALGEQIRATTRVDVPGETSRPFRSISDGGIKGTRPPVLTTPPPPASVLSSPLRLVCSAPTKANVVDDAANSSRDIVGSFVLADERPFDTEEEQDEEEEKVGVGEAEDASEMAMNLGETSEDGMGSFSTSVDDDSSSTTTEVVISPNGRFKKKIRSWMRGHLLGSGSFGTVYEGISDDGTFIAVKEVSLLDQGSAAQQCILQLEQEIALLSQFEHENIVQYYGTDKEESKLYIFLELVTQGSLASLYQKYHLRDTQVSVYTRQILNGLMYLHERNVMHRDIKCANILVHANGSVKLADFGLAKEISKFNDLKSCKGSVYWMAPEVIHPKKTYGRAADIWSLGCTVLEMLTRQIPFPNVEWQHAFYRIGRGDQPPIPSALSREAQDFIRVCVQVDPTARPTAAQLLQHPFVHRSPLQSY